MFAAHSPRFRVPAVFLSLGVPHRLFPEAVRKEGEKEGKFWQP